MVIRKIFYRVCVFIVLFSQAQLAYAITIPDIDSFQAKPPIHTLAGASATPQGLTPNQIKSAYNLPKTGGSGTIALIVAYHHPQIEADLTKFSNQFSLSGCTVKNKCLEVHQMSSAMKGDSGWDLETSLDSEWSHAIAPNAKILVVEAVSDKGSDLMKAVDYARGRKDVVSVSMSWGGNEFSTEAKMDSHFTSTYPMTFFASSGDDGTGASWPAAVPNVLAVGGTSLVMNGNQVTLEKAWSGSGGGVSKYETEPYYQKDYAITGANGKRALPDVAYAADPNHGFSVYHYGKWYVVGGTSAGSPQWAAINTLGKTFNDARLYYDKADVANANYFRDIVSGKNGTCIFYCQARKRYDYVTGLGSPLTYKF
jgi:subtilase family serine protease